MPGCMASVQIEVGSQHWAECASAHDIETKLHHRYVICNGYVVRVDLCLMHAALWDADYHRIAVWAGAPVADSAVPR